MKNEIPTPQIHRLQSFSLGDVTNYVFGFSDDETVAALVLGNLNYTNAPLVRVHSRCLYGEVFASEDCDCKSQKELAFKLLKEEGTGVFVYLEQEGRGCGLLNKAKAYVMKEKGGLDTVEAYQRLGLIIDKRLYSRAAIALKHLGIGSVRLLTNNPQKVMGLQAEGIIVERVPLITVPTPHNIEYLRVKQNKLGQDLGL